MARINLLPWRAERRKQREREFYMMLAASAVAAVLVVLGAAYWMGERIDNQTARNTYLEKQIKDLDQQIEKIKDLEKTRSQLLARKQIIEDLQSNRSQMVHLFDQLAKTIPEGARLTSLKQAGDTLTLEGVAESSTRVATYMRSIEGSQQFGRADLAKIESKEGAPGADRKMPYVFSLSVKLRKADDQKNEMPVPNGAAEAATAEVSVTAAKPADPGGQLNDATGKLATKPVSAAVPAEEKKL
jgi:type IV pilus assembly protein PilN